MESKRSNENRLDASWVGWKVHSRRFGTFCEGIVEDYDPSKGLLVIYDRHPSRWEPALKGNFKAIEKVTGKKKAFSHEDDYSQHCPMKKVSLPDVLAIEESFPKRKRGARSRSREKDLGRIESKDAPVSNETRSNALGLPLSYFARLARDGSNKTTNTLTSADLLQKRVLVSQRQVSTPSTCVAAEASMQLMLQYAQGRYAPRIPDSKVLDVTPSEIKQSNLGNCIRSFLEAFASVSSDATRLCTASYTEHSKAMERSLKENTVSSPNDFFEPPSSDLDSETDSDERQDMGQCVDDETRRHLGAYPLALSLEERGDALRGPHPRVRLSASRYLKLLREIVPTSNWNTLSFSTLERACQSATISSIVSLTCHESWQAREQLTALVQCSFACLSHCADFVLLSAQRCISEGTSFQLDDFDNEDVNHVFPTEVYVEQLLSYAALFSPLASFADKILTDESDRSLLRAIHHIKLAFGTLSRALALGFSVSEGLEVDVVVSAAFVPNVSSDFAEVFNLSPALPSVAQSWARLEGLKSDIEEYGNITSVSELVSFSEMYTKSLPVRKLFSGSRTLPYCCAVTCMFVDGTAGVLPESPPELPPEAHNVSSRSMRKRKASIESTPPSPREMRNFNDELRGTARVVSKGLLSPAKRGKLVDADVVQENPKRPRKDSRGNGSGLALINRNGETVLRIRTCDGPKPVIAGRHKNAALRFRGKRSDKELMCLSRHHCAFYLTSGAKNSVSPTLKVKVLSVNGIYVNGSQYGNRDTVELHPGDEINFCSLKGSTKFLYMVNSS